MKLSELTKMLQEIEAKYGNIDVEAAGATCYGDSYLDEPELNVERNVLVISAM